MWLPLVGLALGIALGLVLNVNVSPDLARYSAVAILAGLDSVLGARVTLERSSGGGWTKVSGGKTNERGFYTLRAKRRGVFRRQSHL